MSKQEVVISNMGGWPDVQFSFYPGCSTGGPGSPWNNGISIDSKWSKRFSVGGLFSPFKVGEWIGGGVIPKEQALRLAHMILEHYKEDKLPD